MRSTNKIKPANKQDTENSEDDPLGRGFRAGLVLGVAASLITNSGIGLGSIITFVLTIAGGISSTYLGYRKEMATEYAKHEASIPFEKKIAYSMMRTVIQLDNDLKKTTSLEERESINKFINALLAKVAIQIPESEGNLELLRENIVETEEQ